MALWKSRSTGLVPGNALRLLRNGEIAFPRMLEAIEAARSHIHLETYTWEDDAVGESFAHALRKKAREGVRVRAIYDGFGSSGLPFDFVESLKDDRVEVLEFRPFLSLVGIESPHSLSRRDHRKVLLVDNEVAFCGGMNLSKEYISRDAGGEGWRDTQLEIRGPVIGQLEELFSDTWHRCGGRPYRPRPAPNGLPEQPGLVLAGAIPSDELGGRGLIRRHYLKAIRRARRSIYIANAYFVPSGAFLRALRGAARRGVDVRLLLPSLEHNDVIVVQLASQHTWSSLLASGIRIFEWPEAHMHAKTAVVDDEWAIVGSYNLDALSLFQNLEVVVEAFGTAFGREMSSMFLDDFDIARELDPADWNARRGRATKMAEALFYRLRRFL